MNDIKQRIADRVRDDLAAIETALSDQLCPYLDLVSKTARHILFSGGKRLRPLLMVLSARMCGYRGGSDTVYACMFEYLHAATLLHDDLVDDADMRRGRPVAHTEWGNETAVLVGDFLLARALSIASQTGSLAVIRIIADITEHMSQGEIHQLQHKGDLALDEAEYLTVIKNKTAVLIQGACRVGAVIAGADGRKEAALSAYGLHLGMAFQMADDLLDYLADPGALGKTIGADLREGKLTLPVIRALRTADDRQRQVMVRMIAAEDFSVQDFEKLVDILKACGGLDYTRQMAKKHVAAAQQALLAFEAGDTRKLLEDIADYALGRNV